MWVGVGVGLFKLMVLIRKLIQLRLARVKTVKLTYVEYTRVVCVGGVWVGVHVCVYKFLACRHTHQCIDLVTVGRWTQPPDPTKKLIAGLRSRVNPEAKRKAQLFSGLTLEHSPAMMVSGLVVLA